VNLFSSPDFWQYLQKVFGTWFKGVFIKSFNQYALNVLLISTLFFFGSGLTRNPIPLAGISEGHLASFPNICCWEVEYKPDIKIAPNNSSDCSFLAISGGGADGAFGTRLQMEQDAANNKRFPRSKMALDS
jgi:hypothetical protein